jgi:hypothetical protein
MIAAMLVLVGVGTPFLRFSFAFFVAGEAKSQSESEESMMTLSCFPLGFDFLEGWLLSSSLPPSLARRFPEGVLIVEIL